MPELTLADRELDRRLNHWRRELASAPAAFTLPADEPATPAPGTHASHSFTIPPETATALHALGRAERVNPLMILASALGALASRYARRDDVVVNTFLSPDRAGSRVVIPLSLSGEPTFVDLLRRTRDATLDGYAIGAVPQELLASLAEAGTAPSAQLAVSHDGPADHTADLHFVISEEYTQATVHRRTDRFSTAAASRVASHFTALLTAASRHPHAPVGSLPAGTQEDARLLNVWNDTAAPYEDGSTIDAVFDAAAAADPSAVAVVTETGRLSYGELDAKANQLAHHLLDLGVHRGDTVAVSLGRTTDIPVAFLGVLRAGAAYVPIDPSYPTARVAGILHHSGARTLVTTESVELPVHDATRVSLDAAAGLIATRPTTAPANGAGPDDLAYVIYTSGSTGQPKGVEVTHRGAVNLAQVHRDSFGVGSTDRVALFSSISFDASIWEIVMALLNGAGLAVLSTSDRTPGEVAEQARALGVTLGTFPPTFLRQIAPSDLPNVRVVVAAGETCTPEIVDAWAPSRTFVNAYGPTETTVCATFAVCQAPATATPPIGRPLANTQVYVLDEDLAPAAVGTVGEVYIGGVALTRGYRHAPAQTGAAYLPNPYGPAGSRLYRTGDTAWCGSDGVLTYLGRVDHQVKLRGFRIELGEVEIALTQHPEVRDAAVVVDGDRLVAYITRTANPHGNDTLDTRLHQHLSTDLPAYMLPGAYIALDALPLSPNGKVDRARLPKPPSVETPSHTEFSPEAPPAANVGEFVARVWASRLGANRTAPEANFFASGGHSLVAAQIIGELREGLAIPALPIRLLFDNPTLGTFAAAVAAVIDTATPTTGTAS